MFNFLDKIIIFGLLYTVFFVFPGIFHLLPTVITTQKILALILIAATSHFVPPLLIKTKKFVSVHEKIAHPVYDLKNLTVPRLAGNVFHFFVALMESSVLSPLLVPFILQDSGFNSLSEVVCTETPTFYPEVEPDHEPEPEDKWQEIERIASEYSHTTSKFSYKTMLDYAKAYRDGTTTPFEVAKNIVKTIHEYNPKLSFLIDFDEKVFLQEAQESTKRIKNKEWKSIFDGIPIGVKDELDLTGFKTRLGTKFESLQKISQVDNGVLTELRLKGALFFGKMNMAEIGITPRGLNIHYKHCRNPHHDSHETGGSSSGCGASVAIGLVPIAVGADGGGSIRIPASFCGVYGLKPTHGRLTTKQNTRTLCYTVDVLGPIASSAIDLTLSYAAMAGRRQDDKSTWIQPKSLGLKQINFSSLFSLKNIKIGYFQEYFMDCEKEISHCCKKMLDIYKEKYNAEIIDMKIPLLEASRLSHLVSITSEMNSAVGQEYYEDKSQFYNESRVALKTSTYFTGGDYVQANRIRSHMIQVCKDIFSKVDVIITPTIAITAPEYLHDVVDSGESDMLAISKIMRYVFLSNFTGIPAVSVPCGFDSKGLPIGLQIQTKWWNETILLKFAHITEREVDLRQPRHYRENF